MAIPKCLSITLHIVYYFFETKKVADCRPYISKQAKPDEVTVTKQDLAGAPRCKAQAKTEQKHRKETKGEEVTSGIHRLSGYFLAPKL